VGIIIVGTFLAMASIFRTMVFIIIPAFFVRRVLALDYDLVASLKG
jgi:hypothetical protein